MVCPFSKVFEAYNLFASAVVIHPAVFILLVKLSTRVTCAEILSSRISNSEFVAYILKSGLSSRFLYPVEPALILILPPISPFDTSKYVFPSGLTILSVVIRPGRTSVKPYRVTNDRSPSYSLFSKPTSKW